MNKKISGFYNSYLNSAATELSDVYKSWNSDKAKAYKKCREEFVRNKGEYFRIVSANTYQFTCGYRYPDPETGVLRFRYHTANNVYDVEIDE